MKIARLGGVLAVASFLGLCSCNEVTDEGGYKTSEFVNLWQGISVTQVDRNSGLAVSTGNTSMYCVNFTSSDQYVYYLYKDGAWSAIASGDYSTSGQYLQTSGGQIGVGSLNAYSMVLVDNNSSQYSYRYSFTPVTELSKATPSYSVDDLQGYWKYTSATYIANDKEVTSAIDDVIIQFDSNTMKVYEKKDSGWELYTSYEVDVDGVFIVNSDSYSATEILTLLDDELKMGYSMGNGNWVEESATKISSLPSN